MGGKHSESYMLSTDDLDHARRWITAVIDSVSSDPASSTGDLTLLLRRWNNGDEAAADRLFPLVYQELRSLARRHLFSERDDHTLPATALVHEAYLKMMGGHIDARDRLHFFTLAATVMRQVLIDHAKRRLRQKRVSGDVHVSLDDVSVAIGQASQTIIELDDALTRLQKIDPRVARVVELHYFGGLDYDETAEAMGASRSTVNRDLRFAKAWLKQALGPA
jgi:RNA polymerase sigma factor (TIGR02999 family)